ncbi:MAG: restriction endonuclease [Candidatus Hydrogenedentes bacterium]|nr:restriction endonuclease [Candidatus Hydrogenedentota bacterium]
MAKFWAVRTTQAANQVSRGRADQGARSAVTGGAQMDGFAALLCRLIREAGIPEACIFTNKKRVILPGFFRATKQWDIIVVSEGRLLATIELKSHVGSFGNNLNNRAEEAMGSALDFWTAFRENAFNHAVRPWLGYVLLLEDSEKSQKRVKPEEPHFKVFPEFRDASYARRYELLCRKLILERHYQAAAFLTSPEQHGQRGVYSEPADDLTFQHFARSLVAHLGVYAQ